MTNICMTSMQEDKPVDNGKQLTGFASPHSIYSFLLTSALQCLEPRWFNELKFMLFCKQSLSRDVPVSLATAVQQQWVGAPQPTQILGNMGRTLPPALRYWNTPCKKHAASTDAWGRIRQRGTTEQQCSVCCHMWKELLTSAWWISSISRRQRRNSPDVTVPWQL